MIVVHRDFDEDFFGLKHESSVDCWCRPILVDEWSEVGTPEIIRLATRPDDSPFELVA